MVSVTSIPPARVYRHWDNSPYCSFPVVGLTWTEETWANDELLRVHCPQCELYAEHDHQASNTYPNNPTATPIDATSAWDIPLLLLHTPAGLVDVQGPKPRVRHLLIEDHSRMRYFNALVHGVEAAASRRAIVMQYGSIKSPQN